MHAHHLRTLWTALAVGLSVLSLALAPGRPAAGEALSEHQLREALLDAVDFPEGWAGDSEKNAEKRGFGVPRPTEPACDGLFDIDGGDGADDSDSDSDGVVRAGFAKSRSGPFVTTVAAAHPDAGAAGGDLDDVRAALDECATFHTPEGPADKAVSVAYDAAPLETGRLGEESLAVRFHRRIDGETASTPVVADLVIVRVGAQILRVAQAGRDDGALGDVEKIAERAVEKLEGVAAGRVPAPPPDQPGTTDL
ncbi:hypothetical protein [Streptomyces specialis]|uniref:hypothetical protein n=1 Tax=Streptomyces specialis TaxID=498367 RepID=UPI00073EA570|nr:hypothetical protein [Streptomyces specialis]